ncbi:MAG: hypothetical protein IPG50_21700 [Myxococcales bacterium]|nr:hypothetical protein [Myxococcales bacterium]
MPAAQPDRHRTKGIFLRLSLDERGELERISETRRLSMTDAVRQLIREEAERAGLTKKKSKK